MIWFPHDGSPLLEISNPSLTEPGRRTVAQTSNEILGTLQDSVNQLSQLEGFAAGLGHVVKTYDDTASGKNGNRPAFKRMLGDAASHRFDLVVFWALDRLTREGPLRTLLYLEQLASSGVKFKSFTEPMIDTTTAVGELLIPILSWIAKQERQRISDRTRAGLETARRKGKQLGRPH